MRHIIPMLILVVDDQRSQSLSLMVLRNKVDFHIVALGEFPRRSEDEIGRQTYREESKKGMQTTVC